MLSILLLTKLAWLPSVCCITNYYMLNCVPLYLLPFFLHSIGNLLAYVVALFESPNLEVVGLNPIRSNILLI